MNPTEKGSWSYNTLAWLMEKSGYNALANWLVETMGAVGALIASLLLMTALGVVG